MQGRLIRLCELEYWSGSIERVNDFLELVSIILKSYNPILIIEYLWIRRNILTIFSMSHVKLSENLTASKFSKYLMFWKILQERTGGYSS